MRRILVFVGLTVISLMIYQNLCAQESKFELNKASAIKDILTEQVGKRVSIRLDGGEELEGVVARVGDQLVHISKLSKRDFYDALVRIDRISAVIIRTRSN
jgi:small nuclear ribonucleoprotein (snRNP)-like protein